MAEILDIQTVGDALIISCDTNPTTGGGMAAPVGCFAIAQDGSGTFYKGGLTNTDWFRLAQSNDNLNQNLLLVRKNPTDGQYATIEDALAAITTNSDTNPFVISVGVGIFNENQLNCKPYVSIVGTSIQDTIIKPLGNHDLFVVTDIMTELSFMSLQSVPSGKAAIFCNDCGDYFQAHKVNFVDCDTNVKVISVTQDTVAYLEYVDYNGAMTYGNHITSSNGFKAVINAENYYTFPSNSGFVADFITGIDSALHILSSGIYGTPSPKLPPVAGNFGIICENGADVHVVGSSLSGFECAIKNNNVGAGCGIDINGVDIDGNTDDIIIENPNTVGGFLGSADLSKITIDPSSSFIATFNQPHVAGGGFIVTGDIYNGEKVSEVVEITTLIKNQDIGLIEGEISDGGGFVVNVSAGFGYLIDGTVLKKITWSSTSVTLSANQTKYIYFNNIGVLTTSNSEPQKIQNILLGRVNTNSSSIQFIDKITFVGSHTTDKLDEFLKQVFGSLYSFGSIFSENATPYKLDVTNGEYYYGANEFVPSGGTAITFDKYYRDGSGGWTIVSAVDTIPSDKYDNGSGTLQNMTAGYYAKGIMYIVGDGANERYFFVYPQSEYLLQVDAENAPLPTPPTYFNDGVTRVASFVVQQGAGNIVNILSERPLPTTQSSANAPVSDHLLLTNLTNGNSGHCFDEKTELLTDRGFVNYKDINEDTIACTLNLEKDVLEYQKIKGKYVYNHFKELVSIRRFNSEILVTDEHRMIILNKSKNPESKYKEKKAGEFKINTEYDIPVTRELSRNSEIHSDLSDKWFLFFGLIISEGHFEKNPRSNEIESCHLYQKNGTEQEKYIENLLNELNVPYTTYIHNDSKRWRIRSEFTRKNILPYLDSKNITEQLKGISGNKFRYLLAGLILGDGSVNTNRKNNTTERVSKLLSIQKIIDNKIDTKQDFAYWSSNEKLIDDLQELCTLNGLRATKRYKKGGFKNGCFVLSISCRKNVTVHSTGKIPYNGEVWCVSVKNTTLVLRRNGVVFIAGNTQFYMLNGSTPLAADMNMAGYNVLNGGTFNSVVVQAHASRHLPNGADPLATAAPTTNLSGTSTNDVGIQNSYSRSDHSHAITGAALTRVNDTNITLTLGGSPTTSLLNAASLTLGWTGTLSVARGGTGAATANDALNNLLPSQVGQSGKILKTDGTNTSWDTVTNVLGYTPVNKAGDSGVGLIYFSNNQGIDVVLSGGTDTLNIGTANADIINIGYSGSTVNIIGTLSYQNVDNLQVKDKLFTVNKGGGVGSGSSAGFEIEEGGSITGWFDTSGSRDGWEFKAPASFQMTLSLAALSATRILSAPDLSGTLATINGGQTFTSATWNANVIDAIYGGTGQSVYVVGDLLYANSTTTLSRLADVATGNALISGGIGVAPSWGKIGLTTHVSGILPIANGGTNAATALAAFNNLSPLTTKGDIVTHDGTNNVRKAIGTNTQVFISDSAQASGNRWGDVFSSILTPAAFAATQNDYNPAGLADANVLRLTSTGAQSVTGIVAPASTKTLVVFNIGASNITFVNASASSAAANRFDMNGNTLLNPNEGAIFWYDVTTQRWRCAGRAL